MTFNKIIVAYDDSEGSKHALEKGIEFLRMAPHTEIILAHVDEEKTENAHVASHEPQLRTNQNMIEGMQIQPLSISDHEQLSPSHSIIINSVDEAISHAKQIAGKYDIDLKYEVLTGKPAEAICKFAKTESSDLIIVGSSSNHGLKRMFLGSTSEKITKEAPCDVLIAK